MSRYAIERVCGWATLAVGMILPWRIGLVVIVAAAAFLWYTRTEEQAP